MRRPAWEAESVLVLKPETSLACKLIIPGADQYNHGGGGHRKAKHQMIVF